MSQLVTAAKTISLPQSLRSIIVPSLFADKGDEATKKYAEFFTVRIRNEGTREAYGRAAREFFHWCEGRGMKLEQIEPMNVATYIELLMLELSAPTVKLHLAAIRMLFDWLVVSQVVKFNPAAAVRGPKHVVKQGKTSVLDAEEARVLIDSIDEKTPKGSRDRALIGVLVYSFARIPSRSRMMLFVIECVFWILYFVLKMFLWIVWGVFKSVFECFFGS